MNRTPHDFQWTLKPTRNRMGLFIVAILTAIGGNAIWQPVSGATTGTAVNTYNGARYPQSVQGSIPPPLFLTPVESSPVELDTHTASLRLTQLDDGRLRLETEVRYRFHNPGDTAATALLRLSPIGTGPASSAATVTPGALSLQADGTTLPLQPSTAGSYSSQIQVEPDAHRNLLLSYSYELAAQALPALYYPAQELTAWRGTPSLRVRVTLPETVQPENWVRIAPTGWDFAPSDNAHQPHVEWLYEARIPRTPFVLQFIHPDYLAQIREVRQQSETSNAVSAALHLGDLYRQLYAQADSGLPSVVTNDAARMQFYDQAVAAYADGIAAAAQNPAAPADDVAALHAGLAGLYRTRVVGTDGRVDERYARLMARAAESALARLPAEHPQRTELVQWQAEGLYTLFTAARDRQDWTTALDLLDRLNALTDLYSGGLFNAEQLAETRRIITAQQALQLLEQDNRAAALRIAETTIPDADAAPPDAMQSLFASWHMTLTIDARQMQLEARGQPMPEQTAAAHAALQTVVDAWQSTASDRIHQLELHPAALEAATQTAETENDAAAPSNPSAALRLTLTLPADASGLPLAQALPNHAQWALLRTLLEQLQPAITETTQLFSRQVTISQPLDPRAAGDHWSALAASLEQQAAELRSASAADESPFSTVATTTLRAQIQAIQYQHAAQTWRQLAAESWITVRLMVQPGPEPVSRTWMATAASPAQVFHLTAEQTNPLRLWGLGIVLLSGLFLLSGLLWWLL